MKATIGVVIFLVLVMGLNALLMSYGLPIPSTVVVMALLALFFAWHGGVPGFLRAGAEMLFRVFPLLFVPALVQVVSVSDIVRDSWFVILFAVVVSSLVGLLVSAFLFKALQSKRQIK